MKVSFQVESAEGKYLVSLSSGDDAFFASGDVSETYSFCRGNQIVYS